MVVESFSFLFLFLVLSAAILTKENENEERERFDPKADLRPSPPPTSLSIDRPEPLLPAGGVSAALSRIEYRRIFSARN
jgi:hypothetical protein